MRYLLLVGFLLAPQGLGLGMPSATDGGATVTGSLTYRPRIALPADAVVYFEIPYEPAAIDPHHRYTLQGRITVRGKLMFINTKQDPVITQGHPSSNVELDLDMVNCEFILGFKTLHDMLPDVVGECLENAYHDPLSGDGFQRTTGGLLFWRKADNHTAFTDGYHTWVNGPQGAQQRLNTERFQWETVQQASNTEYRLPVFRDQEARIRMVNGKWEYSSPPLRAHAGVLTDLIAAGDLDGDGVADAVATLFLNTGGSGVFVYLIPLVNRNGVLVQTGREFLGDRVKPNNVAISDDGMITVDMIAHGPQDPMCCPTERVVKKFKIGIIVE